VPPRRVDGLVRSASLRPPSGVAAVAVLERRHVAQPALAKGEIEPDDAQTGEANDGQAEAHEPVDRGHADAEMARELGLRNRVRNRWWAGYCGQPWQTTPKQGAVFSCRPTSVWSPWCAGAPRAECAAGLATAPSQAYPASRGGDRTARPCNRCGRSAGRGGRALGWLLHPGWRDLLRSLGTGPCRCPCNGTVVSKTPRKNNDFGPGPRDFVSNFVSNLNRRYGAPTA